MCTLLVLVIFPSMHKIEFISRSIPSRHGPDSHKTRNDRNDQTPMKKEPENLDSFYEQLGKAYRSIDESDQPPVAKLGLYATRSLQLFEQHQQRFADNPAAMFGTVIDNRDAWFAASSRLFSETIRGAVQTGRFRTVDPDKTGVLFINAIFALMIRRTRFDTADSIEDDVRDLIDLYLNGVTAERMPAPVGPPREAV